MATRVAVFGAAGRMGSTVCRAVDDDDELELVAAIDPANVGAEVHDVTGVGRPGLRIAADASAAASAGADVAVDFTHAEAARANVLACAERGIHAVVGTTGLGADDLEAFEKVFTTSNCVVAANFAIGAVLMMRFAEIAAPWFDSAEIVELHHDAKLDAPSGTALRTAERMAAASSSWRPDPTETTVLPGARGGVGPGGIHVHAVRLHGVVAHQEVLLGSEGQSLTIRHDSYDRTSFMPGVVLACKRIASHPGLTVGLDRLLGF